MLCSLNNLKTFNVHAYDGPIGTVKDFFFDEKNWVIRYLLIDSDGCLDRSNGFISTSTISSIDTYSNTIHVNFSSHRIGKNPQAIEDNYRREKQLEIQFADFFRRPSAWGPLDFPWVVGPQGVIYENIPGKNEIRLPSGQPNLPSYNQIIKYQLHAINAYLGNIKDILIDEDIWKFQFLEIEKDYWRTSESTLFPYDLIEQLNTESQTIEVLTDLTLILSAPNYTPAKLPNYYFENILAHYLAYTQLKPDTIKRLELSN